MRWTERGYTESLPAYILVGSPADSRFAPGAADRREEREDTACLNLLHHSDKRRGSPGRSRDSLPSAPRSAQADLALTPVVSSGQIPWASPRLAGWPASCLSGNGLGDYNSADRRLCWAAWGSVSISGSIRRPFDRALSSSHSRTTWL